jgi:hypothetical protein
VALVWYPVGAIGLDAATGASFHFDPRRAAQPPEVALMSERGSDSKRRSSAKLRDDRARRRASPRGAALRLVPPPTEAAGSAQRWIRPSLPRLGALAAAVLGLLAVLSALRAPPATSHPTSPLIDRALGYARPHAE